MSDDSPESIAEESAKQAGGLGEVVPRPFEFDLPNQREPVTTAVLEPINNDGPETVQLIHEPHLVIENQTAEWGQPTSNRTPIDVATSIDNRFSSGATIENYTYRLSMNEVIVGNGTLGETHQIPPGTTRTVDIRLHMRNPKMNQWWVSHLRNDESSVITIEISAIVSVDGTTERVPIQFPNQTTMIETAILG
jgi:LEA14-like dessication related protein